MISVNFKWKFHLFLTLITTPHFSSLLALKQSITRQIGKMSFIGCQRTSFNMLKVSEGKIK